MLHDADLARIQVLAAQYGTHAYPFVSGRDDLPRSTWPIERRMSLESFSIT